MPSGALRIAKLIWFTTASLLLLVTLTLHAGQADNSDADIVMIWGMILLSAPLGFVVLLLFAALLLHTGTAEMSWYQSTLLIWLMLAASGYLQWFVVIPKIWRRVSSGFRKQR